MLLCPLFLEKKSSMIYVRLIIRWQTSQKKVYTIYSRVLNKHRVTNKCGRDKFLFRMKVKMNFQVRYCKKKNKNKTSVPPKKYEYLYTL